MVDLFYKKQREEEQYRVSWDLYPKILKKVEILPKDFVLDAGCGIGELSKYIKQCKLYGVDNNELAVEKAKEKYRYIQVRIGDIFKLPYPDKFFDKTFCIEVLEYLEEPSKAFKEILRVTKGEVIISSANFNWYDFKSLFSEKWREQYKGQLERNDKIFNKAYFKRMAKEFNCKVKIFYVSNRFNWLRSLFGNHLASEVVGVFTK